MILAQNTTTTDKRVLNDEASFRVVAEIDGRVPQELCTGEGVGVVRPQVGAPGLVQRRAEVVGGAWQAAADEEVSRFRERGAQCGLVGERRGDVGSGEVGGERGPRRPVGGRSRVARVDRRQYGGDVVADRETGSGPVWVRRMAWVSRWIWKAS